MRFTGVPESRVKVVYLGVREVAASSAPRQSSVLFVGSLFQRRRIDVLIDAFARLAAEHPEVHLDIVGENRTVPRVDYTAQVAALKELGRRLSVRHWVDDETLTTLYAQATAFAFLSEYEGFGFTPLEALAHGAVPVVLDTPVAREIYGDAAVRLTDGPDLVGAVAAALGDLLADPRRAPVPGRRADGAGELPLGRDGGAHLALPRRGGGCGDGVAGNGDRQPQRAGRAGAVPA